MVQRLFAILLLDAIGNFIQLDPPTFTPNFIEYIFTTTSSKDMSRQLMGILDAHLAEKYKKSKDFILRVADPPSINHALMSYFIEAYFLSLSKILDSFKSTFALFACTPPPLSTDKDYQLHIRQTSDRKT